MSLKEQVSEELKEDEGFRAFPYQDTEGVWTFGYGCTYITKKEAGMLLENRVEENIKELIKRLPRFKGYPFDVQRALANMSYQLGVDGLLQFKNTIRLIDEGKYVEAGNNALKSKWAQQTPNRAKRIVNLIKNAKGD